MDKNKKVSELTVEELEELIKRNLFVINTPTFINKGGYCPNYVRDGMPPELKQYENIIISDRTEIKK